MNTTKIISSPHPALAREERGREKLISKWSKNKLDKIEPVRIVATIEAQCNLQCLHCYWSHDMVDKSVNNWSSAVEKIKQIDALPLEYDR